MAEKTPAGFARSPKFGVAVEVKTNRSNVVTTAVLGVP
jgi:hypothetical protein